ncbi:unnamed protein product [Discosporangium mesarthrocarpum]
MSFHSQDSVLVAMYATGGFELMDVATREVKDWSLVLNSSQSRVTVPNGVWGGKHAIRPFFGAAFNPSDSSWLLLYNESMFMHVSLYKPHSHGKCKVVDHRVEGSSERPNKKAKTEKEKKINDVYTIVKDYPSTLLLDFVGGNELLVLENPWDRVRSRLPDALDRKRYQD